MLCFLAARQTFFSASLIRSISEKILNAKADSKPNLFNVVDLQGLIHT